MQTTLNILRKNVLYAKKYKCHICKTEIGYLGHRISGDGIRVDPWKIDAVNSWEAPRNAKHVYSSLGLCNYYRKVFERLR